MKKTVLSFTLLIISVMLVFTGCSSGKGDFELKRSKGITITYSDDFEQSLTSPVPLTSKEIFDLHSNTIVRGTIESVRNIKIDYGKNNISFKALATLKIEKVISGNATVDSTITVLLPSYVDNVSADDSSVLISRFKKGTEGIFLLKNVTETNCATLNNKTFYYNDVCNYFMFGEDHFAIIASDSNILFNADMFDVEITTFASLDEAEAKIQATIAGE